MHTRMHDVYKGDVRAVWTLVFHLLVDQSVVRFDPCAFDDPFLFAATTAIPTRARVKEYTNAINGISNKPIFKVS